MLTKISREIARRSYKMSAMRFRSKSWIVIVEFEIKLILCMIKSRISNCKGMSGYLSIESSYRLQNLHRSKFYVSDKAAD